MIDGWVHHIYMHNNIIIFKKLHTTTKKKKVSVVYIFFFIIILNSFLLQRFGVVSHISLYSPSATSVVCCSEKAKKERIL